jgi:TraG P-loop domain
MIHRTFRSLDDPPKLLGFTIRQWGALITAGAVVLAIVRVAHLPGKPAITLATFAVGLPAALTYVSESGGLHLGALLADVVRWRLAPKTLSACSDAQQTKKPTRAAGGAERLLGVAAIAPDGLLIGSDGSYVRYLQSEVVNPLVLDPDEAARISAAFAQIAARLADRQTLQLYVQATPLQLEELLAEQSHRCEQAAGAAHDAGQHERADAIRRLGAAQEDSIRSSAATVGPVHVRYLLVCPLTPAGRRRARTTPARLRAGAHQRAVRDSLSHSEGIRADLQAIGLHAEPLDGAGVLELLHARFDPAGSESTTPASFMYPEAISAADPGEDSERAHLRARTLADAICTVPIELSQPGQLRVGESLEQVLHLSLAPEQTWLGWLLHMTQAPRPFVLSVHVQATERYRERLAQKRRYKRLYGVNRGVEQRGRPLDPDARLAEDEAAELTEQLASSSGAGIYRLSVYLALREPHGDADALRELAGAVAREVTTASDARVQPGQFAQRALWRSTLPLGADPARRRRKYLSSNVGDSLALLGTGCGSPDGIPLGYALPGRTLERLDPFDERHPNHLLLINGMSGAGKTMSAILLLVRAIAHGASGFIIDRAGHFAFLASLIPGAVSVQIGADGHAINPWDIQSAGQVSAEKVDYLLALHALLLGEHHAARDSYGLTDLESNLLGLAIGEVYQRCALTGEEPRELLLQEELERRYHAERREGSVGIAEALRNLSMRVNNYLSDGPYGYLGDRPTTIPAGSPLVVFDTRLIPDTKAPAALFVICEHVKSQIAATRSQHLAGDGPRHAWAGRSFLVIDEAWKLIERPATGRWFNEFCRRSRHYALWLIAISQQLSDFDNEHGKALLANAAMRLFLRQEARELSYVKDSLALSEQAIDAISQLQTVRGQYSSAYLMNGTRGQGTIQIAPGAHEYWIATSDPARDERIRRQALADSDADPWRALQLLAEQQRRQSSDANTIQGA